MKKRPSVYVLLITIIGFLISNIPNSYQSSDFSNISDGDFSSNGNATSAELIVNQSGISQSEVTKGTPATISLSYGNGTFLTTGNITYTVKFNFSEPFLFSSIDPGSFDSATILNNESIQFHGTPLSKGQNKTGVVTFLFRDGLAEESRKVNLDANLTLDSIENTVRNIIGTKEEFPLFTNESGTFANSTSLFSNETTFSTVFGESPQSIAPELIKSVRLNTLVTNLNNLTSPELAGVINTVQPASGEKILEAAPPLSPPTLITNHTKTGPLNSSGLDFGAIITSLEAVPKLISGFSSAIHITYKTWTPCIAFDSPKLLEKQTSAVGSVIKYLVRISNCSDIFEKVDLDSRSSVRGIDHFFSVDKFDMVPKSVKDIELIMIIPPNTISGRYYFDIVGNVLNPANNIAAETTGRIPLTLVT